MFEMIPFLVGIETVVFIKNIQVYDTLNPTYLDNLSRMSLPILMVDIFTVCFVQGRGWDARILNPLLIITENPSR